MIPNEFTVQLNDKLISQLDHKDQLRATRARQVIESALLILERSKEKQLSKVSIEHQKELIRGSVGTLIQLELKLGAHELAKQSTIEKVLLALAPIARQGLEAALEIAIKSAQEQWLAQLK
jgi:hypothetical protein